MIMRRVEQAEQLTRQLSTLRPTYLNGYELEGIGTLGSTRK